MDHEKVNYVDFFLGATAPSQAAAAAAAVGAAIVAAEAAEIQREMVEWPNFPNGFEVLAQTYLQLSWGASNIYFLAER